MRAPRPALSPERGGPGWRAPRRQDRRRPQETRSEASLLEAPGPLALLEVGKRTERGRRKYFYDDIAAHDKVRLVPMSFNSFELIDAAQTTATATGSVALESVVRGRPVLFFGQAWYHDCEGMFSVQNEAILSAALKEIESGYTVDSRKVRLFMQAVEEVAFKGYSDLRPAHSVQVPVEERVPPRVAAIERIGFAGQPQKESLRSCLSPQQENQRVIL